MSEILAKLKGFRTILINAGGFVASLPTTYGAVIDILNGVDLDSGDVTSFILSAVTATGLLLRFFTSTKVFNKE